MSTRLLLIFLALVLMAGCAAVPVEPLPPADLVVAVPEGAEAEALRGALEDFEAAAGLTVRVESLSTDQYGDRVSSYLLAGRSDYDLVYLPADQLPRWASYHAIQPLDTAGLDREALLPWLPAVTVSGEVMGIPTQPAAEVLWYRADLLEDANLQPPRTWEEYLSAAETLDELPGRYGAAAAAGPGEAGFDFSPYLAGFCAPAAPWDCERSRQEAALALYRGLAAAEPWHAAGRADVANALREGRAAMAILPISFAGSLLDCEREAPSCEQGRSLLTWARVPGFDREGSGSLGAWAVPLRAGRSEAGKKLAYWLAGNEGAAAWAMHGGLPAHRGAAANPEATADYPFLAVLSEIETYWPGLPATTAADELWAAYHTAVSEAVGADNPGAVLEAFAGQVRLAERRD